MTCVLDVIFHSTVSGPVVTHVDKGTEFHNATVKKNFNKRDIRVFITHNEETKAQTVERFRRALKGNMCRYSHHNDACRYLVVLDDILAYIMPFTEVSS